VNAPNGCAAAPHISVRTAHRTAHLIRFAIPTSDEL
jgi:hypothetical protein